MRLTPGTRLGPHEIVSLLGVGGMGEVYRAHDTRLGRDVAVKVIPAELARDPERIRRFEQEARAAGALSHPNVCAIYDIGTHGGSPFVVMELLEGRTLRECLRAGPLPIRKAIEYVAQVARGLVAANEKGIIHRDLKPENLFLTKDGGVKILDFGLAKLTRPEIPGSADENTVSIAATETGTILGTLGYLSPEQVKGEPADHRSDLFALGTILHELLTGQRAFRGANQIETLHAIVSDEPAPLLAVRPEAPPQLARILRYCLAKDPERRIQTSKDVRNLLEDLQRELELEASPESPAERKQGQPVERRLVLTAAHVRQLQERNPRLIGHPLFYLDNRVESDTLVVFLHGLGGDYRRFESVLRSLPCRAVSVSLLGFATGDTYRPVMSIDDHSQLLRILLREVVRECHPGATILVGHSAGADQFLRMIASDEGAGVDIAGILGLGPNVSIETCFFSKLCADLNAFDPEAILDVLKSLGQSTRPLSVWLAVQAYISNTFSKFGSDLEPLKRFAADIVAPFESPGDPLAAWYRAAKEKVPCVRFVFSDEEAGPAEALLARHLERNVLGDTFTESSYVIEPVHHVALLEPDLVARHIESVLVQLAERDTLNRKP